MAKARSLGSRFNRQPMRLVVARGWCALYKGLLQTFNDANLALLAMPREQSKSLYLNSDRDRTRCGLHMWTGLSPGSNSSPHAKT